MKWMLAIITMVIASPVFGQNSMSDEDFFANFKTVIEKAQSHNPEIELLGHGTAVVYNSDEEKSPAKINQARVSWAAWTDADGIINMVFNGPIGEPELSVLKKDHSDWIAYNCTTFVVRHGVEQYLGFPGVGYTWFTWLQLGQVTNNGQADLEQRLETLENLGLISEVEISEPQ